MSAIGNNGSGKSDWYGTFGSLIAKAHNGDVFEGLNVTAQTSPNMTVKVNPGTAQIRTGAAPSQQAYLVRLDTSGGTDPSIATANSTNPRNDLIVAYYDVAVINTSTPNNPNALKFIAVTGNPAATPADPNATAIQTAVGASNPYIVLARVRVDANATQITSDKVTDLRTMASAVLADSNVTTAKMANSAITNAKLATGATRLGIAKMNTTNTVITASYVTYLTIAATSTGRECEIDLRCVLGNGNSGDHRTADIKVQCDGVDITPNPISVFLLQIGTSQTFQTQSFLFSSTPAAGAHTWTIQMKASLNSAVVLNQAVAKVSEIA